MKQKLLLMPVLVLLLVGAGFLAKTATPSQPQIVPTVSPTQVSAETLSYKVKEGVDALTLLKEKASIEQEASGLVVAINGRKASSEKREHWAFYLNGVLASVGLVHFVSLVIV